VKWRRKKFQSDDEIGFRLIPSRSEVSGKHKLFRMPSKATLEPALASFASALSTKQNSTSRSSKLVELDSWYRGELRSTLAKRKEEKAGKLYLEKAELEKLMQWKLAVSSSISLKFSLSSCTDG